MNVLLNNYCNQQCVYCFASKHLSAQTKKEMSKEDYQRLLTFLKSNNLPEIQLGGGEPTLHPHFFSFIDQAIASRLKVCVLSNGLFDEETCAFLQERSEGMRFLFNINHPDTYTDERWRMLTHNLEVLTHKETFFGVNVYQPDQDLAYIYDLCERFRPPYLRYVFVHSVGGNTENALLDLAAVRQASRKVAELTQRVGDNLRIRCCFDCGFVPCQFEPADLGILTNYNVFIGYCGTCPVIDADLRIGHCFLREQPDDTAPLDRFATMKEVHDFLKGVKERYGHLRLYEQCATCPTIALRGCDAGCVGDRIAVAARAERGTSG